MKPATAAVVLVITLLIVVFCWWGWIYGARRYCGSQQLHPVFVSSSGGFVCLTPDGRIPP